MALADIARSPPVNNHPRNTCVMQRLHDQLPTDDERSALISMMKPNSAWATAAVHSTIRAEYPELPVPSRPTFDVHRRGECKRCNIGVA